MSLQSLPQLLRDEPALAAVLGRRSAVLAVTEAARPLTLAGLSRLSSRAPLLVAMPTGTAAQRLVDDLQRYLPPDDVELFPAWETLPFERVSPSVETMGRRLRVLWRLAGEGQSERGGRPPRIVVGAIRALLQRLGPGDDDVDPVVVRPGDVLDAEDLLARLVTSGYRREELVEHRGEVARRGSIIDVFPSTSDAPVRIDLWGDEVDRLSEFSVHDQRSTDNVEEALVFPARELRITDDVRRRAEELIRKQPWGREQWERLSGGLHIWNGEAFSTADEFIRHVASGSSMSGAPYKVAARHDGVDGGRVAHRGAPPLSGGGAEAGALTRTGAAGPASVASAVALPAPGVGTDRVEVAHPVRLEGPPERAFRRLPMPRRRRAAAIHACRPCAPQARSNSASTSRTDRPCPCPR